MTALNNIITYNDLITNFKSTICDTCENVTSTGTGSIPNELSTITIYSNSGTFRSVRYETRHNTPKYTSHDWYLHAIQNGLTDVSFYTPSNINTVIDNFLSTNHINYSNDIISANDLYTLILYLALFVQQTITIYVSAYYNYKYKVIEIPSIIDTSKISTINININTNSNIDNYYNYLINNVIINNEQIVPLTYSVIKNGEYLGGD